MRGSQQRVSGTQVVDALAEIIGTRRLKQPYTLYRHIAERTGVNTTTVMRYHSGYLRSAPAEVYATIHELLLRVRGGQALPFERQACRVRPAPRSARRVPAARVRQGMEGLQQILELNERQILFRYLAVRVGLHPTTVLRYCQGDLETAPVALIVEIDRLRRQIVGDETVVFERYQGGPRVVLRERTRELIELILEERRSVQARSILDQLDRWLALPPGTTGRIRHHRGPRFVSVDVHRAIEEFVCGVEYDPVRTYRRGDRIRHHLFGLGTVMEKIHKNKVRVDFISGRGVILSEAVAEDPYRHQRLGGGGTLRGQRRAECRTRAR
jgi:hypothetical protein